MTAFKEGFSISGGEEQSEEGNETGSILSLPVRIHKLENTR